MQQLGKYVFSSPLSFSFVSYFKIIQYSFSTLFSLLPVSFLWSDVMSRLFFFALNLLSLIIKPSFMNGFKKICFLFSHVFITNFPRKTLSSHPTSNYRQMNNGKTFSISLHLYQVFTHYLEKIISLENLCLIRGYLVGKSWKWEDTNEI